MNHNKWVKKILSDLQRMKKIEFYYKGHKVAEYRRPKHSFDEDTDQEMYFAISQAIDTGRTFKIIT